MKVVCNKCKCSEFSEVDDMYEQIDYREGKGLIVKEIQCDNCGAVFVARMDVEVTKFDLE